MFLLKKKFIPLFKNDSRYYIVIGGRGSGKSFSINVFLLMLTYEVGHIILFSRYTLVSANISIIPEFIEKIKIAGADSDFRITQDEILNLKTGSKIIFKGIKTSQGNQTANLKSLAGITTFVLDEAEELTDEDIFDKIDFSIRAKSKQNRIILILNPTSKESWIYKRFYESKGIEENSCITKDNTAYIYTNYLDNEKNLSKSFLVQAEKMKDSNIDKYKHIMLGSFLDKADGTIFKQWQYGEFDNTLPFYYGSDYGFKPDPDVLVKVAIDNHSKKIFVKEEFRSTELTATELVQKIGSIVGKANILHAESQEQRINEMLKQAGVRVYPTKKYPNSVEDGIKMMLDYEIIVSPESILIGKELNNYVEKNGKPLSNGNDHFLDAIRYVIMGVLTVKPRQISKVSL